MEEKKKKYLFVWHCCKITLGSLGLAEIYTGSLFSEHFRGSSRALQLSPSVSYSHDSNKIPPLCECAPQPSLA